MNYSTSQERICLILQKKGCKCGSPEKQNCEAIQEILALFNGEICVRDHFKEVKEN